MKPEIISVEHLTKKYDLGVIGTGTLWRDVNRWWARLRHQPDPESRISHDGSIDMPGGSILALKDVSFIVQQGETLGIIGSNGSGKSTLLKILSRVTAPTEGRIKVRGRVGSLLEVGTGFHPELTGRENIFLNGAILGMNRAEVLRKFNEIVAFSGVEQFIDTPVKRYSSGMYVRLAFAVAAHLDPDILVVDEVLAVGDVEFQKRCLGKMGEAAKEGRTVLFVSHNLAAVRNLCSRAIMLQHGMLRFDGETNDVIDQYLESTRIVPEKVHHQPFDCRGMHHSGSGEARIAWAQIRNSKGELSLDFNMDEEIEIEFGVENPLEMNLNYSIEILDKNDYPLFHLLSEFEPLEERNKVGSKRKLTVSIRIPPLYLFPDEYYINLWAGIHDSRVDKVERCFVISMKKDRGSKRSFLTSRGRIHTMGRWRIMHEPRFWQGDDEDH